MDDDLLVPRRDVGPVVARLPKVLLHEHLDGGLRPETVLDLARDTGYSQLPADDAEELGRWFRESADSGSLVRYLETFEHTVAVMQTAQALRRVAREEVQDLAADGVVYAEVRYAPELHLERGLELTDVVEAVNLGLREGEELARAAGRPIRVTSLLTAMRHAAMSREIADLVVRYRDEQVSGFDIAGAEAGFPPTRHLDAFQQLARANARFTIHAGEAFGLPSIQEALTWCGADRLGHGVRIVDDMTVDGVPVHAWAAAHGRLPDRDRVTLGQLAHYVRDTRVPLEMCPSSNVQTGASTSIALHPITLLKDLRFRVTVNTDNRLMSGTGMGREMSLLVREAGWSLDDLRLVTINAMKSAFLHFDERLALIDDVIKPGFAAVATDPP